MSQIENGRTGLSVRRLEEIANALASSVAEILEDSGSPDVTGVRGHQAPHSIDQDIVIADWRRYDPLYFDPILAAALAEFLEIGYHGATVRTIAARAEMSVSGIYHHYSSKQQILVTILEHTMVELLARSHGALAEGTTPVERFRLLIENLALYHTHRRELGFIGATEMRSFDDANKPRIAELRTSQQRLVDSEVEAAVEGGLFRVDHPHEASRAAVTLCTALATWWRPGGPLTPEDIAEQYVGFALDLMRYEPRP